MKNKVTSYKGFRIKESVDFITKLPVFKVYTAEEWAYGEGFRCYEWEACSMKEAMDFVDSYESETPVTDDNFVSYSEDIGFTLIEKEA
ncbi:hypothetical protein P4H94_04500 [Paenibacillus macerans]|uniref:hypothetical protein n=1 Tax=Paenibacillus macerans TaxID=44252 RepID=UPI002DBECDB5|nr:hypothetical protein [Paenibacillus macerans]MEC0136148.1 hypothetical protein [Paenibacillus macerans]